MDTDKNMDEKKMEPVYLLKKVLSETKNGGRLRTTTRNNITRLIGRIDSKSKSNRCPECGVPVPSWAAECSACGCVWD